MFKEVNRSVIAKTETPNVIPWLLKQVQGGVALPACSSNSREETEAIGDQ
ncbi:hypothetical protein FOVG_02438 [Fusarium oxysporum f. sp. pisi HDV247]|uniref:Uncharacterized protein n=1 Tax=Fusarium oxysporum f. sp. pisi HDV247 TaxID=1080344 RepID=W9Q3N2_FUSOX|nr:hypothetical protein FOVG_02438 [Fusarium oxysporum f. sp. pisi HDV247]